MSSPPCVFSGSEPPADSQRRQPRARWPALGLALGLALTGCQEPPPVDARLVLDLASNLAAAEVRQPTGKIDFGSPEARRHLLEGWAAKRRRLPGPAVGEGTWSMGDAAGVEFFVVRPRDLEVSFRVMPVRATLRSSHELVLEVNGEPWHEVVLEPALKEYRALLPATRLRRGHNRLQILHPTPAPPPEPWSRDYRVLWDYLQFGPSDASSPPAVRGEKGTVFLPFDTRLDFYLEIPANSFLATERVRRRGRGWLQVTWQSEDGELEVLAEDLAATPAPGLALGSGGGWGRLSFLAVAEGDGEAREQAGIVLVQPRVVTAGAALAGETAAVAGREAQPASPRDARRESPPGAPNVVIYLVDTLRADHLGCYGYPLDTSPRLDRFAQDAYLFENAQAQSSWTRASVASIFTGLRPQQHQANDDDDALPDEAWTLAEALSEIGYRTAAFTGNGNAHGPFGFAQGFDEFEYLHHPRPGEPLATSQDINAAVFRWLEKHADEQPFFLYVHTIDPHLPYSPPEPHRSRFAAFVDDLSIGTFEGLVSLGWGHKPVPPAALEKLNALYDAEIAANDASFGALLDELERRGLYEDSLIVFLSDHGEELHEHGGWTHGQTLYAEVLEIPLIVKLPGGRGPHRVSALVEHIDVAPTVLELAGGSLPTTIEGRSLLPLMTGPETPWREYALAHLDLRGIQATSLIEDSRKAIWHRDRALVEVYDLRRDPAEALDVAHEDPELGKILAAKLRARETVSGEGLRPETIETEAMAEVAEELRALGYIQ